MKHGRLLIISHTEHYLEDDRAVGWGPTIREINHLLNIFDSITHIAVLHEGKAPPSSLEYTSDKVRFVPLKPYGGHRLKDKMGIFLQLPQTLRIIKQELKQADLFQFRAPTGMGVYLIPWLQANARIPGWFKYAGNWMQKNAPFGYRIQKYWLSMSHKFPVTINGHWLGQPRHCLSFENPCLDEEERQRGAVSIQHKNYEGALELCFVGALTAAKGVNKLLEAIPHLTGERIACLHLVGDGPLRAACEEKAKSAPFPLKVHGFLNREKVGSVMEACHLMILPSQSEGFPKVIAEGANYGCVPVVSDVSALDQYIIPAENGFLLSPDRLEQGKLADDVRDILVRSDLKKQAISAYEMAATFTFNHYYDRIRKDILNIYD